MHFRIPQILLIGLFFLLASCDKKTKQLTSQSPDEKVKIRLTGERTFQMDPWRVTLRVKGYDRFNEALTFDYHSSSISKDNITFNWNGNQECVITLTEKNGEKLKFKLNISENRINFRKITR